MNAATRRTLTGEQMRTILAAIRAVDGPAALLPAVLTHVYDALLQADGRRLADLKHGGRIAPDDWQIPVTQWDAIAQAASERAEAWGTGPQLRAGLLERMPGCFDDPTAPTGHQPVVAGHGLRLLCVSIRGNHGYLVGNPNVHPIDLEPAAVPAGVGTRFSDLDEIKRYVRTELRGMSVLWQVRVIDDAGAVLMYGFRAGPGGTGERWTWRPPTTPAPETVTRTTAGP
ncbi:hypothetical protein [Dactylosporangium sp. CA-139066]|uniref:hypothetical protein n=1 Tax=Dactylosporangium sp. CA-139066 TaxID=3239930 RepID=UPI003D8EC4F8